MAFLHKRINFLFNLLFKPVPNTFEKIARHADNKLGESIIWLMLIGPIRELSNLREFSLSGMLYEMIWVPIMILLFVFFLHLILKKIFRKENYVYDGLLYSTTLIFILISLIQLILSPFVKGNWMSILSVYQLILLTISLKSLTSLKIWQSIFTVLASIVFSFGGYYFLIMVAATIPYTLR